MAYRRRPDMQAIRAAVEHESVLDALPCPFCDASSGFNPLNPSRMDLVLTEIEAAVHGSRTGVWWVSCFVCSAIGPAGESPELAVAKWNRAKRPLVAAVLALTLEDDDA